MILKTWESANRLDANGTRPVTEIVHRIMPGVAASSRLTKGDLVFDGLPYLARDILVMNVFIQWFGTNVGSCFLESTPIGLREKKNFHPEREFVLKYAYELSTSSLKSLPHMLFHVCSERCARKGEPLYLPSDGHYYSYVNFSQRDAAVINALMRWLGSKNGRAFVDRYQERRTRIQVEMDRMRYRELGLPIPRVA